MKGPQIAGIIAHTAAGEDLPRHGKRDLLILYLPGMIGKQYTKACKPAFDILRQQKRCPSHPVTRSFHIFSHCVPTVSPIEGRHPPAETTADPSPLFYTYLLPYAYFICIFVVSTLLEDGVFQK